MDAVFNGRVSWRMLASWPLVLGWGLRTQCSGLFISGFPRKAHQSSGATRVLWSGWNNYGNFDVYEIESPDGFGFRYTDRGKTAPTGASEW